MIEPPDEFERLGFAEEEEQEGLLKSDKQDELRALFIADKERHEEEEWFSKLEDVAFAFLSGATLAGNKIVPESPAPGSKDELAAREALVTLLLLDERPLDSGIRMALAALFDPERIEPRRIVIENRKKGPQPNRFRRLMITRDIERDVKDGAPVKTAISRAVEKFGISESTAYRVWGKYKKASE
jgi:hypothetical protein